MLNIKLKMKVLQLYEMLLCYKVLLNHKFKILPMENSIKYIIENKCSISRFGDGEFKQVLTYVDECNKNPNIGFQQYSPKLGQKLYEVLVSDIDGHAIGLPSPIFRKQIYRMKHNASEYWKYQTIDALEKIATQLKPNKLYLDSFFTRFYMDFEQTDHCYNYIRNIRKIWDGRDIIIVEGDQTLLGVGNDLFDNAMSIRRIICPATNAFDRLDDIECAITNERCKESSNTLILVALGPTATVLAYNMAKLGYQTIDIGHIDIEYEWFLRGAAEKIPIPGKYVNEARNKEIKNIILSEKYKDQIIKRIV